MPLSLGGRKTRWLAAGLLLVLTAGASFGGWRLWVGYQERQAQAALAAREFDKALIHLKRAMFLRSNDADLRLLAAQAARRGKDYSESMEHARVCEQSREMAVALALEYALWRVQNGDLTEGTRQLAVYREQPDAPDAALILEAYLEGFLKRLTGDDGLDEPSPKLATMPEFKDAQWAAAQWLDRRTGKADHVQGLVWRGRLYGLLSDHPRAVADLRKALELDPEHFEARLHLAAQVAQGSPAEAESHLQFLLKRHPDRPMIRLLLATFRRNMGELEAARQLLDELLVTNPASPPLLVERGMVELDAGRPEQAESWLRKAEATGFDRPELALALGRCMRLAGRLDEAQRYETRFEQFEAQRQRAREAAVVKSP